MTDGAQSPGNTHEDHIGARFRAGREAAGLSRGDISGMTNISVAKIARIELKGTGTDAELDAYRDALKITLGEVLEDNGAEPQKPIPASAPSLTGFVGDGAVRLTEWNGFRRGDLIKISGDEGTFKFLFFHQDDHQTYVEVSGPVVRYRGELRGTRLRSIKPERVQSHGRRR